MNSSIQAQRITEAQDSIIESMEKLSGLVGTSIEISPLTKSHSQVKREAAAVLNMESIARALSTITKRVEEIVGGNEPEAEPEVKPSKKDKDGRPQK